MEKSTPYVNLVLLPKYIGQTVRLICRAVQMSSSDILQVETVDKGTALIQLNNISIPTGVYLCITGNVLKDMMIDALAIDSFGDSLDMTNANSLIGLMQRAPAIFI